jgi:phage-related protein
MAVDNMTTLNVTKETLTDKYTIASGLVAAAGTLTIDLDGEKAKAAIVRVENNDAAATAYVTVKAGTGIDAEKGDEIYQVAKGDTAVIRIEDTSRFLDLTTGKITIAFNDSAGAALAAGILEDLVIEAFVY